MEKRDLRREVDPETVCPVPLRAEEIEDVHEKVKALLVQAQPIATSLYNDMIDYKNRYIFAVLLFDSDGILVKIYDSVPIKDWLEEHRIFRWTDWNENKIGPNIFSIGSRATGVTQIRGEECYARCLQDACWYYHPILREDKTIWGGLAIVCPPEYDSPIYPYLLSSLIGGLYLNTNYFTLLEYCTSGTEGMGFIVIDCSGEQYRLLSMSNEVRHILSLPEEDYFYERLETVFDAGFVNSEFWDIIEKRRKVNDKILYVSCGKTRTEVCISTTFYDIPSLHTNVIVLTMNSLGRIRRLAAKQSSEKAHFTFSNVIGESEVFRDVLRRAKFAAATESNLLLLGESGVGKDVLAQAIHNYSSRNQGPYVTVNSASFSKELIASELFGYEEGAFTGARKGGSVGKFELANKGTLFLDEIGDMPMDLQTILLRVLEEHTYRKVGGTKIHETDVRIIAATNLDLHERMKNGLFREDLYYRLGVVRLVVPPLRERRSDILLFADVFIRNICQRQGKPLCRLLPDAQEFFLNYSWPGNVRELSNVLEGIISTGDRQDIDADTVVRYLGYEGHAKYTNVIPDLIPERERMLQALDAFHGNRVKAAEAIGMSRSTFYRRLKEYGIAT